MQKYPFILYMKAGPYCGFGLDEIISIKQREDALCGKFYWGYGGVFCHPKRVMPFVELALEHDCKPVILFSSTPSSFFSKTGRVRESSLDKLSWQKLPEEVLLVGNQYALVATHLERVSFTINLGAYRSMLGDKPGKSLDQYIRYRIDKSCAMLHPATPKRIKEVNIHLMAEIISPYCVYVR
jgi:hypothetical protein